jgi:hypothetical protein
VKQLEINPANGHVVRRLNSPGPIADAFLLSRAFVPVIIGPVGSAKTVQALRKLRRIGQAQKGVVDDRGIIRRRARVGVIRESYPNLEKNTIPSWFRIHAESDGKFNWRAPFTHRLQLILKRDEETGQPVDVCDFEIEFRAIGDKSVEEACRGWEVNAVLVDEADLQPADLIAFLSGRIGRFSDLDPDMVVDPTIILSLNAPYIDNWIYKFAIERDVEELIDPELLYWLGDRPLIETFIQPGGREPNAENLHNLPNGRGYYIVQAALNKHRPDYVARMIDNKFVPMQHGQAVNPQFSYEEHVRDDVDWDPRRKLILSLDNGLTAAGTFLQRTPENQLRTLREVVHMNDDGRSLRQIGPTAFGQSLKAALNEHFPDLQPGQIRVVADPAAFASGEREDNEHDWILAVRKALGLPIYKAKSNSPQLRNEAIWRAMSARGGYAVHRSCKNLIRGHLGGYRYRSAKLAEGEQRGHLEIADTIHTHVADAEQYGALEGEHVISDIRGRGRREGRTVVNDSSYEILGGIGR